MNRGVRKDHGSSAAQQRRSGGGLATSSTDSCGSSSHDHQRQQPLAPSGVSIGGVQLRPDNLKDFRERVDSTIQQLSGLVSLLSSHEVVPQPKPSNSSNRGDTCSKTPVDEAALASCCCRCHSHTVDGSCSQVTALTSSNHLQATSAMEASARRRSTKDACISMPTAMPAPLSSRRTVIGDVPDDDAAAVVASGKRRKESMKDQHQEHIQQPQSQKQPPPQQQQQQQQPGDQQPDDNAIRFLWFDANHRRYSVREAELICAKTVKRLHLSVHYFRVGGEDLLLLEKDCSEDGLAFLDVDSVVAFEGLSVEKVLKLQKLGCQLRPEDLSREFAVEKGHSKYYVVPVEDAAGEWHLCEGSGAQKLESMKRLLEQQELRQQQGGANAAVTTAAAAVKRSA